MEHIPELARARRSVRSFDGRPLRPVDLEALKAFLATVENPYGIPVDFRFLDAKAQSLACPVITGTNCYLGAKVARVPHGEEAFGYSLEMLVLFAQSLGIGTTWIGGTMDRGAFERAMELDAGECMPCVTPLGYPAEKMSLREAMMRKGAKADSRAAFESLFFDGDFLTPLTEVKAGVLRDALECVRLAPSAVNRQPWRVLVSEGAAYFYKKGSKGFANEHVGDLQKVDLGIALRHFALCAQEQGLRLRFTLGAPEIDAPAGLEFIAGYALS